VLLNAKYSLFNNEEVPANFQLLKETFQVMFKAFKGLHRTL
jgi:hypothetical protein